MQRALSLLVLILVSTHVAAQGKDKPKWAPSPHIAATDPLRPEAQLKKMKVPPGFEIQLVAADPDIKKPINIAFDAAGRLWVTESIDYPFPAKDGQNRDTVKILEDFGPDGRARKITTFADKLNIPIGVLPDLDGKGALVYSIPAISHIRDGKRAVFYSGFGSKDTHGMTGEFMRGFDGWVYACHGFSNASNVKSKDGSTSITMNSGNTYRIKPDGSRIEHFTYGQVNPFGIAIDPLGNLYTADCHSRPLTMLLRGALYEHFGNKHDGLGFAPHMNNFNGHSTALCGIVHYSADQFPQAYHGKLFLGDVVLNRLNSYRLDWTGATPSAVMEDFITSQDPWFRPVDIKLGPDGCLYFADFYTRIIGHYEVPLNHPGRDNQHGRIWRVVWRGKDGQGGQGAPKPVVNLLEADGKTLIEALKSPNLAVRLQAADQLVPRGGKAPDGKTAGDVQTALAMLNVVGGIKDKGNAAEKAHALWILERRGELREKALADALTSVENEIRVHAHRIVGEKNDWLAKVSDYTKICLQESDPFVLRAAAETMAAHPRSDFVPVLLAIRQNTSAKDTHLTHAVRLALRQQLRDAAVWRALPTVKLSEQEQRTLADVCLAVQSDLSAEFVKTYLGRYADNLDRTKTLFHHVVRHGGEGTASWAVDFLAKKNATDKSAQGTLLKAFLQATQERGGKLSDKDRGAFEGIAVGLLDAAKADDKQLGAELAGTLKLTKTQPQLLALVVKNDTPEALRKTCITTLVTLDAAKAIPTLRTMLLNEKEMIAVREQVANALAATNHADAHAALVKALQDSPARLQTTIALGMAGSPQGGDRLLAAIETGKASPRLLQDRAIELRLASAKIPNVKVRLKTLMKDLPPADQKTQELIARKQALFTSSKVDPEIGQKIFQKSCAVCHQISNQGAKIGPQLDGIGVRGLERLLEDVLDPNRNVDQAFRTTQIITKNGQTFAGLFLREEGKLVILGDKEGKEVRIEKALIEERSVIPLSPMPSNFAETLSEEDFNHLLAYLLRQRGKE